MKYIILCDGQEFGPADEETLKEWAADGRVREDTPVRKEKIVKWFFARELDFLAETLARVKAMEEPPPPPSGIEKLMAVIYGGRDPVRNKPKDCRKTVGETTAFINKRLPDPAPAHLRVGAAAFDAAVAALLALLLYFVGGVLISSGIDPSLTFHLLFGAWAAAFLAYMAGTVGVFSQSFGMWFFGIMLKRSDMEASPVFLLRSFVWVLLALTVGWLAPLIVFLNPRRGQGLHDMLVDTAVIRITARPQY